MNPLNTQNTPIADSELIINSDGSAFHLHILPGKLAKNIILVGDPGRVETVASYFDTVDYKAENREFKTITGTFKGKDISCVSTGIGTDNIDIVLTELYALVNVDFKTRCIKKEHTSLNIVRIGTSGSLQKDIDIESWLLSEYAMGFDPVLNFYAGRDTVADLGFEAAFRKHMDWNPQLGNPYIVKASNELIAKLKNNPRITLGTTISAPGFYGPQGRVVRLNLAVPDINERLPLFCYNGHKITNYEMECSAIYALSALLGHKAATACVIIANRQAGTASKDYQPAMKHLITHILQNI